MSNGSGGLTLVAARPTAALVAPGQETERPEWYGTQIRVSPVTGKRELHYPTKTKLAKMTVSFACLGIAICIVLLSVTGAVVFRVWIRNIVGVCELDSGLYGVCTGSVYNLTGGAAARALAQLRSGPPIFY